MDELNSPDREEWIKFIHFLLGEERDPKFEEEFVPSETRIRDAKRIIQRDLDSIIKNYQIPLDLRPLYQAIAEKKPNEFAKYGYLGHHPIIKPQSLCADTIFINERYIIYAILLEDKSLVIDVAIDEPINRKIISLDLEGRALLVLEDQEGKRISAPFMNGHFAYLDAKKISPISYIAKLEKI